MSKLSPQGASLLAAARKEWGSSADAAERVRAAVDARLVAEPPPSGTRLRAAMDALRRPGQVLLVVLLGGALASSAMSELSVAEPPAVHTLRPIVRAAAREPRAAPTVPVEALPEPASPRESEPQVLRTATPSAAIPRAKPALSAPPATTVEAPIAEAPPAPPKGDGLAEEARILRRAQLDLQERRAIEARSALDEHATRFPNGVLREEELTLRVLLLCQSGDVTGARAKRAELDRLFPSTSHAARLATSCAGTKDP